MELPMVVVRALVMAVAAGCAVAPWAAEARPLVVRVNWGGGTPQAWTGTVEIVPAAAPGTPRPPLVWRTLSAEADAASHAHQAAHAVLVHQPRAIASDGVELTVDEWQGARLVARMTAATGGKQTTLDVPVVDLITAPAQEPLDALGNRLTMRLAADDPLHVEAAAADALRFSAETLGLVHRPGDRLRVSVDPLLATRLQGGHTVELRMRLKSPQGAEVAVQAVPLTPRPGDPAVAGGPGFTEFEPVVFDVSLPAEDGVSVVELEALERGGLRWSRPLASRAVELVALGDGRLAPAGSEAWKPVYELDPGSPRLLERLRRLPGVSLPSMPLPDMPLPSLSMAAVPLPKFPSVPLPAVPMPNVSAMVPRLSGPLSHGHSTLVTHPLGPMLRLPSGDRAGAASWEGVALAGLQPGVPHAVEIEYPTDQDATVGITVLEADTAGVVVQARHTGGFTVVRPPFAAPAPALAVHRFVFWPATKQPVVVIANASTRLPALVGRLRVAAGPAHLAADTPRPPAALLARAGGAVRRVHAFADAADLARGFGGAAKFSPQEGRLALDWSAHVSAARHFAELVAARGGGGTMLTAFADGAAIWPSTATRHAPRWDAAAGSVGRDLLAATARVHARHGLTLIPAARFDAPLPAIEAVLAEEGAGRGIVCIGRDGTPRRLDRGSLHYNPLHPLVQRAVEEVMVEMAGRLRGATAVSGVAVVIPHDGWLHLPGLAWPLDDDTFARFAATLPSPPAAEGETRFAERARLVEGPFREAWIAWRCAELARFHARLAAAVAAIDPRWSLHVVPSTLFTGGEPAEPGLPPDAADDRVRLAGFDPAAMQSLPEAGRVVYVWPRVHAPTDRVRERAAVMLANRSAAVARAAAASRRKAAVLVEKPWTVDVDDALPHGPFGSAAARDPVEVMPAECGSRGLAEALGLVDAEAIFDATLVTEAGPRSSARGAFASMPAVAADAVRADQPLVVRVCRQPGLTWGLVANLAAAPVTARLTVAGRPARAVDAVDGGPLAVAGESDVLVPLAAWGVRCVLLEGECTVTGGKADYAPEIGREVADRVERLRLRRQVLETPVPLDVLDNPAFELGAAPAEDKPAASVTGWEVVEPRRGAVSLVPGGGAGEPGRGLEFSSFNGLATLRSNPFPAPPSGRISVAAWLRVTDATVQPPLRIAIEGVQGDREYYRFAAIGGLTGGRPLTGQWSQFVLQVDELPAEPVESLRVRFDLLGPGRVQIDDVRVFDLAFDDSQRARITTAVSLLEHQATHGDLGGCLVGLEGFWPMFLDAFVSDAAVAAVQVVTAPPAAAPPAAAEPADRQAGGMFDRLKSWWQ
jgi:hypothetical protein